MTGTRMRVYHLLLACLVLVALLAVHGDALALGSTPVTVTNPADIAKAEGIQHSFQANLQCANSTSNGFATFCSGTATLPANQRVVIEWVSLECFIDSAELLRRAIVHTATTTLFEDGGFGSSGDHTLNIIDHSGAGGDVSIGQPVRFYGDAGTQISVEAQETGSHAGSFFCTFGFTGQAIDTP